MTIIESSEDEPKAVKQTAPKSKGKAPQTRASRSNTAKPAAAKSKSTARTAKPVDADVMEVDEVESALEEPLPQPTTSRPSRQARPTKSSDPQTVQNGDAKVQRELERLRKELEEVSRSSVSFLALDSLCVGYHTT